MLPLLPHYPRRFRRRLLLPPGWVALGFLLLLGCLLVRKQEQRFRPVSILPLIMPPLKLDTASAASYQTYSQETLHTDYNPYVDAFDKRALVKINHMRPWRSFSLSADRACLKGIKSAIITMQADTVHAGGIRIAIDKHIAYAQLIALLDLMNQLNQRRCWLDIIHQPITFYAITPLPLTAAEKQLGLKAIDLSHDVVSKHIQPVSPLFLKQRLHSLRKPDRRPLLLLLLAVATLLLTTLAGTQIVAHLLVA